MDLISIEHREEGVFDIKIRDHAFAAEIGRDGGGKDHGADPAELLVGSLGACVGIMVRSYCQNHGYTDGEVSVSDFLLMLSQWGNVGSSCDCDGGGVGVTDFLYMLAQWGPCP